MLKPGNSVNADENEHREEQSRPRRFQLDRAVRPACPGLQLRPGTIRQQIGHEHEARAIHQAGDDAGHEQMGDRRFRHEPIEDHRDTRRNQNSERPRGGQRTDRIARTIAFAHQGRIHDAADRGHGRRARSGNRREQDAAEHGGHAEAAAQMADKDIRQADQSANQASGFHQAGGEKEERHRHEGKMIDVVENLLADDLRRDRVEQQRGEDGCRTECDGDRNADQQQPKKADDQDRYRHRRSSVGNSARAKWRGVSSPRTVRRIRIT